MFEEVAVVVPSVTKTKRKWSPGLRPAGVVRTGLASARPPPPNPNQSIAVAIASRLVWVTIGGFLYLEGYDQESRHRTSASADWPPPNVRWPGLPRAGSGTNLECRRIVVKGYRT